jgi:hypothetical protein
MTHGEFVARCRAGTLRVHVDPALAARHVGSRLLLPLVRLPLLGAGVALALLGWIWSGLAVIATATLLPWLVARTAPQLVLDEALGNPVRYRELLDSGVLRIES